MKRNDKGVAVELLQRKLNSIGFNFKIFGFYGPITEAAVVWIQRLWNLEATGIYDERTQLRLDKALASGFAQGIDVSVWNGNVDWNGVNEAGKRFAIIKYSEGISYKDPKARENIAACTSRGIDVGVYHFYRFFQDPIKQAENFMSCGLPFKQNGYLPPVLDVEWQDNTGATNARLMKSLQQEIPNLKRCLNHLQKLSGRRPMLYTQASFWDGILGGPEGFAHFPLWVVDYQSKQAPICPSGWKRWTLWQYSNAGKIGHSPTLLDLNRFWGGEKEWKRLVRG